MTKNNKILILSGSILLLVALAVGFLIVQNSDSNSEQNDLNPSIETPDTNPPVSSGNVVEEAKVGFYEDYDESKLTRAADGKVVLFFKASWCPTCSALDRSLNSTLDQIPANISILKLDYDKEIALKQKYGVTYQHTLVQVDQNGNEIKQWSSSFTLDEILDQIV